MPEANRCRYLCPRFCQPGPSVGRVLLDFRANRGAELNETEKTPDEAVGRLWLELHRNGPQQL
jgi:hypothetical protein